MIVFVPINGSKCWFYGNMFILIFGMAMVNKIAGGFMILQLHVSVGLIVMENRICVNYRILFLVSCFVIEKQYVIDRSQTKCIRSLSLFWFALKWQKNHTQFDIVRVIIHGM